jgi:hypothetical protein
MPGNEAEDASARRLSSKTGGQPTEARLGHPTAKGEALRRAVPKALFLLAYVFQQRVPNDG